MNPSPEILPLDVNDVFQFECSPLSSCFNACCRDLNQYLTPYDILRLRQHLNMSSKAFLDTYTIRYIGPETGLPVVTLKPVGAHDRRCPFVTAKGCRVYENRPSSCRAYPLARVVSRDRRTGVTTARYVLVREPHCRGFESETDQTPETWTESQGLAPYNAMNDLMLDIISLKNQRMPGPMPLSAVRLFEMACYDLDAFRKKILIPGSVRGIGGEADERDRALCEDEALLRLALGWLRRTLFSQDSTASETGGRTTG